MLAGQTCSSNAHLHYRHYCLTCTCCRTLLHWATVVIGACSAGVDSLFITGGIHAKDIAAENGETDEQKLLELCQTHKGQPTYTMEALQI